jgi:hypothetical protein
LAATDHSCGCTWFNTLSGCASKDWGVCGNPASHRAGLLTFENQGCTEFEPSGCFQMSCGVFLRPVMILFCLRKKRLEASVNLSQFPENRKKQNCDHEQQELDSHFLAFTGKELQTCGHSTPHVGVVRTNVSTHEFLASPET